MLQSTDVANDLNGARTWSLALLRFPRETARGVRGVRMACVAVREGLLGQFLSTHESPRFGRTIARLSGN